MTASFYDELAVNFSIPTIPNEKYRSIIGSLIFAATRTLPDISLAVGMLSQFVSKPLMFLYRAAMRVLAYLYRTKEYGLVYNNQNKASTILSAATDSDYASDKPYRK